MLAECKHIRTTGGAGTRLSQLFLARVDHAINLQAKKPKKSRKWREVDYNFGDGLDV